MVRGGQADDEQTRRAAERVLIEAAGGLDQLSREVSAVVGEDLWAREVWSGALHLKEAARRALEEAGHVVGVVRAEDRSLRISVGGESVQVEIEELARGETSGERRGSDREICGVLESDGRVMQLANRLAAAYSFSRLYTTISVALAPTQRMGVAALEGVQRRSRGQGGSEQADAIAALIDGFEGSMSELLAVVDRLAPEEEQGGVGGRAGS